MILKKEKHYSFVINRPVFIFKPQHKNFLNLFNKDRSSAYWVSDIADAGIEDRQCSQRENISCSLGAYGLVGRG